MVEKETEMLNRCIAFLRLIGIAVMDGDTNCGNFLPGLSIQGGVIIINKELLKFPGDILHEAGHIAVVPAAERNALNAESIAKRENREAEEMMAIAWSYAACIYLDINPHFVFHDDGYKGGGSYIADAFNNKQYFGLPMLQWIGLAFDEKNAKEKVTAPYPAMVKWLRD
jgi:hypothetical protein